MKPSSKQPARNNVSAMPSSVSRRTRSTLFSASTARRPLCLQLVDDAPRVRLVRARRVDQQHDPVGVGGAGPGGRDHRAVEAAARLENAGRIDEDQLRRAGERDAEQPRARRLHLRRDDRQLAADELVQQRRFAGVRRPDQRDIAAARGLCALNLPASPRSAGEGYCPRCVPVPRATGWWARSFRFSGSFGCLPVGVIAQPLQQRRGGGGLGGALRRRRGARLVVPGDAHRDRELQRVVRAVRPDEPVFGKRQAAPLRPFLQQRFRIARRPFHIGEARPPPPLDKGESRVKPAVEIDRRDHRLEHVGQDRRVARRPGRRPRPATAGSRGRGRSRSPPRPMSRAARAAHGAGSAALPVRRRTGATANPRRPARAPGRQGIRAARNRAGAARAPRPSAPGLLRSPAARSDASAPRPAAPAARNHVRAGGPPPRRRCGDRHARIVIPAGPSAPGSFDPLEQPAVTDRERPFPDLPPAAPNRRSRRRGTAPCRPDFRPGYTRRPTARGCPANCRGCRPSRNNGLPAPYRPACCRAARHCRP